MKLLSMKPFLILLLSISLKISYAQKQDMQIYLKETKEMVKNGKYAEALERHVWFHHHALEHQPSMTGVRLSFALSDWKSLGEVYPPAMDKLIAIRNEKTKELLNNGGTSHLFADVKSINRTLQENIKTVELFETILAKYPEKAQSYWHYVKDDLFTAKHYQTIQKFIGNPIREFDIVVEAYQRDTTLMQRMPSNKAFMRATFENNFVKKTLQLIDFASALNDDKSAKEIQKAAYKVVDDYRLRDALSNHK